MGPIKKKSRKKNFKKVSNDGNLKAIKSEIVEENDDAVIDKCLIESERESGSYSNSCSCIQVNPEISDNSKPRFKVGSSILSNDPVSAEDLPKAPEINFNAFVRLEKLDAELVKSLTCTKETFKKVHSQANDNFAVGNVSAESISCGSRSFTGPKINYSKLSAADQQKVDIASMFVCNFLSGSRVFAKWSDGRYYPGNIVSIKPDNRYQVRFCDRVIADVGANDIFSVSQLSVDVPLMISYTSKKYSKKLFQLSKISACPNIENSEEWCNGFYEMYNIVKKVSQKVSLQKLVLDPSEIVKPYLVLQKNITGHQPVNGCNAIRLEVMRICKQFNNVVADENNGKDCAVVNDIFSPAIQTLHNKTDVWSEKINEGIEQENLADCQSKVNGDMLPLLYFKHQNNEPKKSSWNYQIKRKNNTIRVTHVSVVKCKKCGKIVQQLTKDWKKLHCLDHLRKEQKIYCWFKCLRCTKKFIQFSSLKNYLKFKHKIQIPSNENYEDESKKYSIQIEKLMTECFSNLNINKTSVTCKSKVKCLKCRQEVGNAPWEKKRHVLRHVRQETNVKWFYKCLVCAENVSYHALYFNSLKYHFKANHPDVKMKVGIHYKNRELEVLPVIREMVAKCFSDQIPYYKTPSGKEKIKCLKCSAVIGCSLWNKKCHVLQHIQEETDTKWLFQCLICPPVSKKSFSTMYHHSIVKHFQSRHKNIKHQKGVNYTNREETVLPIIRKMVQTCFPCFQSQCKSVRDGVVKTSAQSSLTEADCSFPSTNQVEISQDSLVNQNVTATTATQSPILQPGFIHYKKGGLDPAAKQMVASHSTDQILYYKSTSSTKKITCLKCCAEVGCTLQQKRSHVLQHIQEETDTKWLFQCLVCPPDSKESFVTMYHNSFMRHFQVRHVNVVPEDGINYINKVKTILPVIQEMIQTCFRSQYKSMGGPAMPKKERLTPSTQSSSVQPEFPFQSANQMEINPDSLVHHLSADKEGASVTATQSPFSRSDILRNKIKEEPGKEMVAASHSADQIPCYKIPSRKNSIKCLKCCTEIICQVWEKKFHVLQHVREETNMTWLFLCLICPPESEKSFATMYQLSLEKHFEAEHKNIKLQQGINYINREETAAPLIEKMLQTCFESQYTGSTTGVVVPEEMSSTSTHSSLVLQDGQVEISQDALGNQLSIDNEETTTTTQSSVQPYFIHSQSCFKPQGPLHKGQTCVRKFSLCRRMKIKCLKCSQEVSSHNWARKRHVLQHVYKETDIKWLFKCLICPKDDCFYSMQHEHIKRHCETKHPNIKVKMNVHYKHRKHEAWSVVKEMMQACFPRSRVASVLQPPLSVEAGFLLPTVSNSVKVEVKDKEGAQFCLNINAIRCNKCGKVGSDVQNFKMLHCLHHLREEFGVVESLFACLHCEQKYPKYGLIKFHLQSKHKIGNPLQHVNYKIESENYSLLIDCLMKECFSDLKKSNLLPYRKRKVTCLKCDTEIYCRSSKNHVISHLRKETNVTWVFKCLLCPKYGSSFTSMYINYLQTHFKIKHRNQKPKNGINYKNRSLEVSSVFQKMMQSCFKRQKSVNEIGATAAAAAAVSPLPLIKSDLHLNIFAQMELDAPLSSWKPNLPVNIAQSEISNGEVDIQPDDSNRQTKKNEESENDQSKNDDKIKCKKCGQMRNNVQMLKMAHCLGHLRREFNIRYLFKCLHCEEKYPTFGLMKLHLESKHKFAYPLVGVNYEDYLKNYLPQIESLMSECFSDSTAM